MFKRVTVGELRAVRSRSLRRRSDGARRNVNWLRPRQAARIDPSIVASPTPCRKRRCPANEISVPVCGNKVGRPALVEPVRPFHASSRGQQWHASGATRRARSPEETIYLVFRGGDDGNRTHDPLLAKQMVAIWQSLVDGYLPGTMRATHHRYRPITTPVPHCYWHANGTVTSPNPHDRGLLSGHNLPSHPLTSSNS